MTLTNIFLVLCFLMLFTVFVMNCITMRMKLRVLKSFQKNFDEKLDRDKNLNKLTLEAVKEILVALPILKGYAELGRIGGSQSRNAMKDLQHQTEAIKPAIEELKEEVKKVPDEVLSKINQPPSHPTCV